MVFWVLAIGFANLLQPRVHDWLRFHNLEIDWTMKSINFTRCPPQCNTEQAEAEQLRDAWSDPVKLEEGDRLFAYPKQLPWSI